jgi:pimeloyl-ACP methyl ester carboxylesterase
MWKQFVTALTMAGAVWPQAGPQVGMEGTWQGALEAGALKLRVGLHIVNNANGDWSSTFDSIDQGASGLPVAVTTVSGAKLHFEMPRMGLSFDGTLSADGQQIAGTITQGVGLPIVFKRSDKVDTVNRPQTPKPPFPYKSIEVTYENKQGKLAGTLTIPSGDGPFPAAILITGSGPENRDEEVFGHKPFLVIADYLSRRGLAVLRLDDRGVGASTGNSTRQTIGEMATDVLSGVAFLKARPEINPRKIGVIGHSEGGIVGPLAASRSGEIAFVVMLAGPGVTGEQIMYLQAELIAKSMGAPDASIAQNRALQETIFQAARSDPDEKIALENFRSDWQQAYGAAPSPTLESQAKSVMAPEIRSFAFFDPATVLGKLRIPVLALNGSRDLQVPPAQNLPAIKAALTAAGNQDFEVMELPGLNHLFQTCQKCTAAEYGALEETFSPKALEVMAHWLTRHTR